MPAAAFLAMISSPGFLGDPLLKTQHLLGACEYERVSETEVVARQQLRAGHLRFVLLSPPDHTPEESDGVGVEVMTNEKQTGSRMRHTRRRRSVDTVMRRMTFTSRSAGLRKRGSWGGGSGGGRV